MSTLHSQADPPERPSSGNYRFPIVALAVTAPMVLTLVMIYSVVLLKLWANGNAEQVSVIGLIMMVLVIVFRWVQLKFISSRIGGM